MAYRSADPTELELRERRTRIRRDHDELQEQADQLARKIAEASRGGITGAIGNLFGGMSDDELARARTEHAALETQIAALVQQERELDAELAGFAAKRDELAARAAARLEAARSAPGPLGDQLRAIAAERAVTADRQAAFDAVLGDARRAATAVEDLVTIESDARAATAAPTRVAKVLHNAMAVLDADDLHTGDGETIAARRSSQTEHACTMIGRFLDGFARLAHPWPDPKPLELARKQLASLTARAFDVASARSCLERLELAITGERNALGAALAQLDARERELAADR